MDVIIAINYTFVFIVLLGEKVTKIAGDCKIGSKVTSIRYSETIVNHTIVGPVLLSITAINERECEKECHLAVLNLCSMFNYYPSSKVCELLYKDRAAEYLMKKKNGSTFKTRKCLSNPCLNGGQCYSLGDQNNNSCLYNGPTAAPLLLISQGTLSQVAAPQELVTKANTSPVCIGSKDNSYGKFFAPADGQIKTFKLVHISGGISLSKAAREGNWGTLTTSLNPSKLEILITDTQNLFITPPPDYPVSTAHGAMRYDVPGFNNMSPELVFPEISPSLAVTKGKEFRIWFGQDFTDYGEGNNSGTSCADVYVYYTK